MDRLREQHVGQDAFSLHIRERHDEQIPEKVAAAYRQAVRPDEHNEEFQELYSG